MLSTIDRWNPFGNEFGSRIIKLTTKKIRSGERSRNEQKLRTQRLRKRRGARGGQGPRKGPRGTETVTEMHRNTETEIERERGQKDADREAH